MKLHRGPIADDKVRRAVEAIVTLKDGETAFATHDTTAFDSGAEGFVITDARLIFFNKKGMRTVPWSNVTETSFKPGFPWLLRITHAGGTETFNMANSEEGTWAEAALRAASQGDFAAVAAAVDAPLAARGSAEDPSATPLRLFHGRVERDKSRDWNYAIGTVVVGAILLVAFRFVGSMSSPYSIIFVVSYWVGLVLYPFLVVTSIRDAMRPGERKVVYCVNGSRIVKKVLRGESDPLWNASEAPSGLDAAGLRDEQWERGTKLTIHFDGPDITLVHKQRHYLSGEMTHLSTIKRDEFDDDGTVFRALATEFGLKPPAQ